jgi:hypothetical protein
MITMETPRIPCSTSIETYIMHGAPGFGISDSSTRGVLEAAGRHCRERGLPLDPEAIIASALELERALAHGRAVAADDVVPIVRGGATEVHTLASGAVRHEPIACDEGWVAEHLLFTYDPGGRRHRVPGSLEALFTHPHAGAYVTELSGLALRASDALGRCNAVTLADTMRCYVTLFDTWSGGRLTHEAARQMAGRLEAELGRGLLAWKQPGAGAASSLVVLLADGVMHAARTLLARAGWVALPALVTGALDARADRPGGPIRITAGHRIDLVGAADLGQDPSIGVDGVCCSIAINPRCELTLALVSEGRAE